MEKRYTPKVFTIKKFQFNFLYSAYKLTSAFTGKLVLALMLLSGLFVNSVHAQANAALGRPVISSSVFDPVGSPNSNLVDGNFNTFAATSNTQVGPNAEYFMVDLGTDVFIDRVVIGCRASTSYRLRRFLLVTWPDAVGGPTGLGTDPTSYVNNSLYNRLAYQDGSQTSNVAVAASGTYMGPVFPAENSISLNIGLHKARYIMIMNLQDDFLDPTELQVFETAVPPKRSFTNGGFETGIPNIPTYDYIREANVPGWSASELVAMDYFVGSIPTQGSYIELWRSGYNGVSAQNGTYFAELNAYTNGMLEQEPVCAMPGETFTWSFAHRGRDGVDVMRLRIDDVDVAEFADNNGPTGTHTATNLTPATTTISVSNPTTANGWTQYSGTWTNTSAMAQMVSFGFRAVSSGSGNISIGNFLDNVSLRFSKTLVYITYTSTIGPETTATASLPKLRLNGTLTAPATVQLNITAGDATRGRDYTTVPATGPITIAIPAGTYDGTAATDISLAPYIRINMDAVSPEPDEIIFGELQNSSSPNLSIANSDYCSTDANNFYYYISDSPPIPCTSGNVYAVSTPDLRQLVQVNPATGTTTNIADLFASGPAATTTDLQTSAIALDQFTNTIWYANRTNPRVFSYNLATGTYDGGTAFNLPAGIYSLNKAAYNPRDRKVYFHDATNNVLYTYAPSTPAVAPVALGSLSLAGTTTTVASFNGGDIAFDGLGNLTGAFSNANVLAVFPATYDANGNFLGISLVGQSTIGLTVSPASVAFLPDGNYLVGSPTGIVNVNTTTGAQTTLSNFGNADFASCAAPAPNIKVTKTATSTCGCAATNVQYTLTVSNIGQYHALNTTLFDALPAGVTVVSGTLNGVAIAGLNNAGLASGIPIKSATAITAGQLFKGESATIVLNCTAPQTVATYSNQAFVKYDGVETLNLPNDQIPSDDSGTAAVNDATVVNTTCTPLSASSAKTDVNCFGAATGTATITATGGTGPYTYSKDGTTFQASNIFTGLTAGNYTFTVRGANTCTITTTASIVQPTAALAAGNTKTDVNCFGGTTGAINVTVTGGTAPYTYQWSGASTATTEDLTNIGAGTYNLTITDAKGCTTTQNVTLLQPAAALAASNVKTDINCFGGTTGAINVTVTGGTAPYTYQWSGASTATTEDLTNIGAGTYNLTITDARGCTTTQNVTIAQPTAALAASNVKTDINCFGGTTGAINVTVTGGTAPYTYQWSGASTATTEDLNNIGIGTYNLTIRDAKACTTTQSVTITQPAAALAAGNVKTDINCFGGTTGAINVTVTGGTAPYTYQWSGASTATTEDLTNIGAGTYNLTITDARGCTATQNVTLLQPAVALAAGNVKTDINCFGGTTGAINVTVTGGTAPYTYQWSGASTATTEDLANIGSGTYNLTITDAKGCTTTQSVTLLQPTAALAAGNVKTDINCFGGTTGAINVTVTGGTAPYTYQWSGASTATTEDLTNIGAGTYNLTITDARGCTATQNVTLLQPAVALAAGNVKTDINCFGGTTGAINVTVTGGTAPYTYQWSGASTATTEDLANIGSGTYNLTITDAKGCTTTQSVTLLQPTAALAAGNVKTDINCFGGTTGAINVTVTGGTAPYTYQWSGASTATTEDLTNIGAGTYNLTIRDAKACTTTQSVTISQPTAALAASNVTTDINCFGGTTGAINVTVTGGTAPYNYQWSGASTATTEDLSNIGAGTYNLTITDARGCTTTQTVTIAQPTAALAAGNIKTDINCFGGTTGAINITVTGGTAPYTYQWSGASTATTEDLTNIGAGTYNLTITDAKGCTTTQSVVIAQPAAALAASNVKTDINCFGGTTGAINITVTGGTAPYTYQWSGASTATTEDLTNIGAGTYNLTITDARGCTATQNVTLLQPTAALAAGNVKTDINCFGGTTGAINVTVTGGTAPYTYQWSGASTATTEDLTNIGAGTYNLTITDARGCTATQNVTIAQPTAALAAGNIKTDINCFGGTTGAINVTVTGGTAPYTYQWSGASTATTEDLTNIGAGTYNLTITDARGCTATQNVSLLQPTAALAAGNVKTDINCFGGTTGAINVTVSGGTAPYTYQWSGASTATTEDLTNIGAGTYNLTITDAKGCTTTQSVTLLQPVAALAAGNVKTDINCFGGTTGSINVTVTGGTAPYTYQWSGASTATTEDLTNIGAGTYKLTITDAKGCTTTQSVTISQPTAITSSAAKTDANCFGSATGTATITASGGTGTLTYSKDGTTFQASNLFSGLAAGSYTFTVKDANACSTTVSTTIAQPTAITINTQPNDQTVFVGGSASFTTMAPGGSGITKHQWQLSTDNGVNWSNLSNGGVYSGTSTDPSTNTLSSTLTISGATLTMSGYLYRDVISQSDATCTTPSNSAKLMVNPVADLAITKIASSNTPIVGSNITFTLTANNNGPSAASNVSATDVLPSGYTFVSASPSVGTYDQATGVWAIGNLANGANATLSITATVNATGLYVNTATVSAPESDPTPTNNTSSITPEPVPVADVAIIKTVNNTSPNVGSDVTFTLTASNTGPSGATNVSVADVLPSGYTFVSATPSGSTTYNSTTGIWAIGNLSNGANATLDIIATVNAAGSYVNTATITSTENDPTSNNNSSTSTTTPVPLADVSISKNVNGTSSNVGENVTFTLTANNAGPSDATNVISTDILPAGYTFVSAIPSGSTTYNSATGIWTIGNLVNGASASLNITAKINASGSYTNTAIINANQTDPNTPNNTSSVTITPGAVVDIGVAKTVDNLTPNVGSNVTFTITASNAGPSNETGAEVSDLLPTGYTFVSASSSIGTYNNTTGIWAIGNLADGASATLSITATVNATGIHENIAVITGNETDPNTANNTATSTPVPLPVADVRITKTANNNSPDVGSTVTFILTASSTGPSAATNVSATDVLPNGYTFVSASPSVGTYDQSTGIWTVGDLANGANATLNIVATVNATGNYANTATISAPESDPTPTNNTSSITPVPVPVADIAIVKTVDNTAPNVGSTVNFTLTANNTGPSAASNVSATDVLPGGYTFVSASPSLGNYDQATGIWTIGNLANGANATLSITATVNATGNYVNTATISAPESDPTPTNNTSSITPVPVPVADVAIVKTVDNTAPNVGSTVNFTLTASNTGPSAASNVSATDALPGGYTFVSANPSMGTYDQATGVWAIGNLANGANATLSITATVNATGLYANTATITALESDPTPTNNTSSITPVPVPVADVAIVKTVDNTAPNVGSTVTFTLTASNTGPSAASNVSANDVLPSGYTFVSASPSLGNYDQATGIWTIGNLANGANATLSITATVNATGNYANTATITAQESDPTPTNNTSNSTPTAVPVADVAIVKTVDNTAPNVGSTVTFTLTANNTGPSAASNVSATDVLPGGYTFVSANPSVGIYDQATGVWAIGNLANGANATLSITATVNATGNYVNTTTIGAPESDPTPTNNTSSITPTPVPVADVAIVKTVNNTAPNVGSTVTFTLTANNTGPSTATNVSATDVLPDGYTFVSANPSVGTYDQATGLWTIGNLANGANATLSITATVNATGNYVNTATISAPESDPTPTNNTSTSTPVPVPVADVAIVKTVDNTAPNVGSTVTFTLTANNAGPSAASNVSATDVLPGGYTFVSAIPSVGNYDQATGIWTIGNLANGANATLSITATVNATGNYVNTATISAPESDPTPTNNTSSSTPTPVPVADVSIVKTTSKAAPNVGANVTFTLIASNAGPSDATDVNVTDILPSGYTFVSASPTVGTYDSTSGIWSIGSLTNSANATLNIVSTVNANGNYTNTASITALQNDPNATNNNSSVTSTPIDLKIAKTGPASVSAGTTLSYQLTISNEGTGNALSNVIDDVVPSTLSNVTWTATAQGTSAINSGATGNGNHVIINANIPAGAGNTVMVDITGQVSANETATTLSNIATVTSPDASDPIINSNTVTTTIGKNADIQIQKTGPGTAVAGNTIAYTITVTNAGPSDASNINVVDNIPAGLNNVSWTAIAQNGASLAGPGNGTGNINLFAAIPAGSGSLTINVNGTVDASYAGTGLTNTATATPETGVTDPTPASSTVNTDVTKVANVRITKSGPANIAAGEAISYQLHIVNDGPSNALGVLIADAIPSVILNPTWTATVGNGATVSATNGTGDINITADIPSETGVIDITVTGTVNPAAVNASTFSNTATANFPAGSTITDPEPGSNTSTVPTLVNNTADMRVSKNGPANVNILDPITYTIVVTNAGLGDVTGAIITDNVPADVTVNSWSALGSGGATVTGAANGTDNNVSTIGNIPANPNAKITITIQGVVNSSAAAEFTNTAIVTAGGNPQSSVTTAVNRSTDIQIDKNGTQSANAGSAVSYTIKVSNNGPVIANGITINDAVPSEIENVTWSATAFGTANLTGVTNGNTNVIQVVGDVPIGEANYLLITVNGNIRSSVGVPSISNTASITLPAGLTDFDTTNQSSTAVTTITKQSDVAIVKTASSNAPVVGSNITFTLVANNTGPSDANGVNVTDALPNGYTFVSANPSVGTYNSTTGIWNIDNLANGGNATLNIVATVNATGSYINTATISATETDPNTTNNSSTVTPVPSPLADVAVSKTASSLTPNVGSNITFTITAANAGPSAATGVTANDVLPSGYTFVSANAPAGTSYNNTNGVWTIGNLANGTNTALTIIATVNASGDYANNVTISANETDPTATNNTATVTPTPVPVADVSVVKTVDNTAPVVGSNVVFTIRAANAGPSDAVNVTATDVLPTGYIFVSAAPSVGTYDSTTGIWTIGNLANGANATLNIVATVNATGTYANTATVSSVTPGGNTTDNTSTVTPVPTPLANVSVVKTVDNSAPVVGSNVVFTIRAANAGPSEATGVVTTDLLPTGYTFVSAAPSAGTYDQGTGIWTIGNLANGADATLNIVAIVNATGTYANTATVSSVTPDGNTPDNTSTVTPVPTPLANVSVLKTVDNAAPVVGSNVVFTIRAANAGPSEAANVTATDLLPTGYTFVSATPSVGTYDQNTGIWTIGNLVNGADATLNIVAIVNATGTYANTATVSTVTPDGNTADNTSTVTPVPTPLANVSVVKTVDNTAPVVGSNVVFTIRAANAGPSEAANVTATDVLPAGYIFVSATPSVGTYDQGTGIWTIGNLANGADATLNIVATVNATSTYANTASVSTVTPDGNTADNTSTVTPVPTPLANVSVVKTVDNTAPVVGSNVVFTIRAANAGPSEVTGVVTTDLLPTGYTFVSAAPSAGTYDSTTGIWNIGNLANGGNATLNIVATINATGIYANTATISSVIPDGNTADNTSTVTPVPTPLANVSVVKTVDNATPVVGSNVVFTIRAANAGPSQAANVTATDLLPTGYTFVSAAPSAGTYDSTTGIWTIGNLANGADATLNIVAIVNATGHLCQYRNR
jgi:uncharacterized repeat protein (TIGR01451 family)